jgi:hypothetical protein
MVFYFLLGNWDIMLKFISEKSLKVGDYLGVSIHHSDLYNYVLPNLRYLIAIIVLFFLWVAHIAYKNKFQETAYLLLGVSIVILVLYISFNKL